MPLFSYMPKDGGEYDDQQSTGLPTPTRTQSFSSAADPDFNPNRFQNPSMTPPNAFRRSSIASDANWSSFGQFQWARPSMWSENTPSESSSTHVRKHSLPFDNGYGRGFVDDVRSIPMVPDVSQDPIYREKRSSSFSIGQSQSGFGFDEIGEDQMKVPVSRYSNVFQSSLPPMSEEEEDDAARFRSRSKSSGAAFGLLSSSDMAYMKQLNHPFHPSAEPYDHEPSQVIGTGTRRPSVIGSPTFDVNPMFGMTTGANKEQLPMLRPQRRFSFATDMPHKSGSSKEVASIG
jgi:hypothetical protein